MNLEQKDRTISGIILLLTLGMTFYVFSDLGGSINLDGKTIKDIISIMMNQYLDFVLIAYVFTCFQIAGFIELKYKQDFIMISLLSIFLTPLSLIFILQNEDGKD